MEKICQSCAMPLNSDKERGTETDGSLSDDYCIYCYRDGAFTAPNLTMDEQIAKAAQFADQAGMTAEQATEYAKKVFPTLKRWQ